MCKAYEWAELIYASNGDCVQHVKVAFELFVKDCLELQRCNRWAWLTKDIGEICDTPNECAELAKLFRCNQIDPSKFAYDVFRVLMCVDEKKNTLRLIGTPNSCKSLLAFGISHDFICAYVNNHNSENEFYFSCFLNKSICLCEELFTTTATAEDFKSILAGSPIMVSKKYNEKQLLSRTPIILTSNHVKLGRGHLGSIDEAALSERCFTYVFHCAFKPACHVTPRGVAHFLYKNLPKSQIKSLLS